MIIQLLEKQERVKFWVLRVVCASSEREVLAYSLLACYGSVLCLPEADAVLRAKTMVGSMNSSCNAYYQLRTTVNHLVPPWSS
jgi:hypothetical protein